jgi:hypothetical protein
MFAYHSVCTHRALLEVRKNGNAIGFADTPLNNFPVKAVS